MERKKITKIATFLLIMTLVFSGIIVTSGTTLAQDEEPVIYLASADITVDVSETEQSFTGTYTFEVDSAGSGISEISGTLWEFDEVSLSDFSARYDGNEVDMSTEDFDQHKRITIPVENDINDGDEITITMSYTAQGLNGEVKTPIWTPEITARGDERIIDMSVNLPTGNYPQGDSFPNINRFEDNTASYYLLHMPSFVQMSYGTEKAGIFTLNNLMSIVGVVAILGFFGIWYFLNKYFKREAEKRKESESGGGM